MAKKIRDMSGNAEKWLKIAREKWKSKPTYREKETQRKWSFLLERKSFPLLSSRKFFSLGEIETFCAKILVNFLRRRENGNVLLFYLFFRMHDTKKQATVKPWFIPHVSQYF